ncbi:uncharacterized protein [Prorops nasuta]|uniref:uncharacterized protein n=1 Tax=Prorops nasuta TaxID=863751 RepID=UPI0034CD9579
MLEDSLSKTFKPIVKPLKKLTEHNEAIFVAPKHEIKQEPIRRSLSHEEYFIIPMKRKKSYLTSTPQRKDFIDSSRFNVQGHSSDNEHDTQYLSLEDDEEEKEEKVKRNDEKGMQDLAKQLEFPVQTEPPLQRSEDTVKDANRSTTQAGSIASKYLELLNNDTTEIIDKNFGVKIDKATNKMWLGKCAFKVDDYKDFIIIDKEYYRSTKDLFELIFMKEPEDYTKDDLGTYKSILSQPNVQRQDNTSTGKLRGNKGHKWKEIISTLFSSKAKLVQGKGYMRVTNNPVSYVHWNDPNKLVERLKLLIASSAAGHTNHHNEIQSIIEELHEEGGFNTGKVRNYFSKIDDDTLKFDKRKNAFNAKRRTISNLGCDVSDETSGVNISVLMDNLRSQRDSFTKQMNEYSLKLNECLSKCEILEEKITALLKKHTYEIDERIEKLND